MTKRSWVVFCLAAGLAGWMGQVAAFGASTNAAYDVTATSVLSVAGHKLSQTESATIAFLSDNTFTGVLGTNVFTGTYTASKSGVALILDTNGVGGIENDANDWLSSEFPGVTLTYSSAKFTKMTLAKTSGLPAKLSDTIKGKGSETVGGKTRSKGFSIKTSWAGWTLTAGTNF
ncbi:MAG TPA: hypothetical protein VMV72_12550 [Verrucomicrobiae bacterium]|nr:hypothetical protein [Verrucomicrobiae bacterium]